MPCMTASASRRRGPLRSTFAHRKRTAIRTLAIRGEGIERPVVAASDEWRIWLRSCSRLRFACRLLLALERALHLGSAELRPADDGVGGRGGSQFPPRLAKDCGRGQLLDPTLCLDDACYRQLVTTGGHGVGSCQANDAVRDVVHA